MRFVLLLSALTLLIGMVGCNGVVRSKGELRNTVAQSVDLDLRQITDDWHYLWLVDRQYRLTKWHTR